MLTKIRAKRHSKLNTSIVLTAMVCLILMDFLPVFASADCPVIDDAPIGLQIQGAPPILMITLDDSGSMDFSLTLLDEPFGDNGYNWWSEDAQFSLESRTDRDTMVGYIYADAGDHSITTRKPENEEPLYWYTQFYGSNKQAYNPNVTYEPWPLWNSYDDPGTVDEEPDIIDETNAPDWSDPNPGTVNFDMDPRNPRSHPMYDNRTVDMEGVYYTFDSGVGGVTTESIRNTDGAVIIDDYGAVGVSD